jgi:hypothetical protein
MTLKKKDRSFSTSNGKRRDCDVCKEAPAVVVERTRWLTDSKSNTTHYFCAACKIMEMKKRGYL